MFSVSASTQPIYDWWLEIEGYRELAQENRAIAEELGPVSFKTLPDDEQPKEKIHA